MFDIKLPDYEVIILLHYNEFGKKLEKDIFSESSSFKLNESCEYQEEKDLHWEFQTWDEAVQAGEFLNKFCSNPNLLLLKVKANYNEEIQPIVYKDLRSKK